MDDLRGRKEILIHGSEIQPFAFYVLRLYRSSCISKSRRSVVLGEVG